MDRYIQQLAEDFREASENVPTTEEIQKRFNIEIPEEMEMFTDVELYLRLPPRKLSSILGIEKVSLPPPEKLSKKQTVLLCEEMIKLLNAYHFSPDFPKGLPVYIKYRLLYEHWDRKHVFTGEGNVHIEFCVYAPDRCPFPEEFCRCKDFLDFEEDSFEGYDEDDDPLPF